MNVTYSVQGIIIPNSIGIKQKHQNIDDILMKLIKTTFFIKNST